MLKIKRKTIRSKIIGLFLPIALLFLLFCAAWSRTDASADDHTSINGAPKLYNVIARLSKSQFPSEYNSSASEAEKSGVFTLDGYTDEQYPVYFYRGKGRYIRNAVKFAGFCWLAVRTTTSGGVKLVYNGTPLDDGVCPNGLDKEHSRIGLSDFNIDGGLEKGGYMYGDDDDIPKVSAWEFMMRSRKGEVFGNDVEWDGSKYTLIGTYTPGYVNYSDAYEIRRSPFNTHHYTCGTSSITCEEVYYIYNFAGSARLLSGGQKLEDITESMFGGYDHDSVIKTMIDGWYAENMVDYTSQLEDAVYCNDRTIVGSAFASKDGSLLYDLSGQPIEYGAFISAWRLKNDIYSVDCSNIRDSFTVSSDNGNGQLTYPVGLLTMDEVRLTDYGENYFGFLSMSNGYYSSSNSDSWTMSPYMIHMSGKWGTVYLAEANGHGGDFHNGHYSGNPSSVRPVITVNNEALVYCGEGTTTSPYTLEDEYCEHVSVKDKAVYAALRDCDLEKCPELKSDATFDDANQIIRLTGRDKVLSLNLDSSNLNDVSDLVVFQNLENLSLRNNHIEDISPLLNFMNFHSTVELAGNNILNTSLMRGICNNRVKYFFQNRDDVLVPEQCADGSYEGELNLAFDWLTNQNLEDVTDGNRYKVPDSMMMARSLTESIFDYQPPEDDGECDSETEWCYGFYYNWQRDIPASMIAQYFDPSLTPDDLLYLENAELEVGSDGDILRVLDNTKRAILSYRISWEKLFGDAWNDMDEEMKNDIIARTGGNREYWNIATLTLRSTWESAGDAAQVPLPETFDAAGRAIVGFVGALLGASAAFWAVVKKR